VLDAALAELEAAKAAIAALKQTTRNQEALIQSRQQWIDELTAAIKRIANADHKDWPIAIDDARRLVGGAYRIGQPTPCRVSTSSIEDPSHIQFDAAHDDDAFESS
jgi:hypothetical protein